jgi:hypothetical protein
LPSLKPGDHELAGLMALRLKPIACLPTAVQTA